MAHRRQSRLDSGPGFEVKVLETFQVVPSSLASGLPKEPFGVLILGCKVQGVDFQGLGFRVEGVWVQVRGVGGRGGFRVPCPLSGRGGCRVLAVGVSVSRYSCPGGRMVRGVVVQVRRV
jgi:hypothetical protein